MKKIKSVSCLIYLFHIFRNVNIATILHERLSKTIISKWLYYIVPIIMFSINIFNLIRNKVLYTPHNEFTYFNDISNSCCLTLLFFLSYFLSGYYPPKLDEFIHRGIKKKVNCKVNRCLQNRKKSHFLLVFIGIVLFIIAVIIGYSFYRVAKLNTSAYWIYHLDNFGRIYYCLFLGITWYLSISLLMMTLIGGFIVYKTIEFRYLIYIDDDFNKNLSILSAIDIVLSTFSYGIFYIIGSILFIFNDRNIAERYKVYNTFYKDEPSFFLLLLIILLSVLAYLPLQELLSFMKKRKDSLIDNLNKKILLENIFEKKKELILKRNDLIQQSLIYTTMANKAIIILSIFIPLVGVIFQGIELFKR
ncbi:MAG: hypothetical protein HFG34_11870 [Eubacterium sp.]|nr:hypothetical protein [Eubacterium sp.]